MGRGKAAASAGLRGSGSCPDCGHFWYLHDTGDCIAMEYDNRPCGCPRLTKDSMSLDEKIEARHDALNR